MQNILSKILFIFIIITACNKPVSDKGNMQDSLINRIPKVLYITTGANYYDDDIDLPRGIIVALQTFNKRGITVRLEPRDVLFDKEFLSQYNIIILSTATGYHDADRKYSLTYMTDGELNNLDDFVAKGGILIAGDNVGRNHFDGADRLEEAGMLNKNNYPLSKTFGLVQKEKNLNGYRLFYHITDSLKADFNNTINEELWTLVPDTIISKSLKVLGYWKSTTDSIPAITQNDYGDGTAFLLSSSDFLDAAGGDYCWDIAGLQSFYNYIADRYNDKNNIKLELNPWPDAHPYAFCVSFNAQGESKNYKRVLSQLKPYGIKPTFFVNGQVNDTIVQLLEKADVNLASTGYRYTNYEQFDYPAAINDVLQNHYKWNRDFKGFRFPYTNPAFSGLLAIDMHGYTYESSISVNNLEFIHGSVFPYNIIITHDKFYKSTDVLEIAPTYHDDYFFLKQLKEKQNLNKYNIDKKIQLYSQYLNDFWQYSVKPYNGAMVFLGHPDLVAYDNNTFMALKSLIDTVQNDNAWFTDIENIAKFRAGLDKLHFYIKDNKSSTTVLVKGEDKTPVKGVSIKVNQKPSKISAKQGKAIIKEIKGTYFIVFNAFDGQELNIFYLKSNLPE